MSEQARAKILIWYSRLDVDQRRMVIRRLGVQDRQRLKQLLYGTAVFEGAGPRGEKQHPAPPKEFLAGAPPIFHAVAKGAGIDGPPGLMAAIRAEIGLWNDSSAGGPSPELKHETVANVLFKRDGGVIGRLWHMCSKMFI